jgi:hypothetical protein
VSASEPGAVSATGALKARMLQSARQRTALAQGNMKILAISSIEAHLAYLITIDFLEVRASFLLLSCGIAEPSCDFAALGIVLRPARHVFKVRHEHPPCFLGRWRTRPKTRSLRFCLKRPPCVQVFLGAGHTANPFLRGRGELFGIVVRVPGASKARDFEKIRAAGRLGDLARESEKVK